MDVDRGGLKIKGQAQAEKAKERQGHEGRRADQSRSEDLDKRESELKEKALRNKVVRSRKTSESRG